MHKTGLIAITTLVAVSLLNGGRALAQTPTALSDQISLDEDIKLFRKDVRSVRKQFIAANMTLTDAEAQQFWPIYDRYTSELMTITDRKYALIKEYALNYTDLTDDQAESYIKGRAAVEEDIMKLRLRYVPVFRAVLSGKSTALFFQIDWRLSLVMDLQLSSQIPLIEP